MPQILMEDGSSTSHAPVGFIGIHSPTPIAVGSPGMQSPTPDESPMMNSPTVDGMSPIETTLKELDDANETTTKVGRTRALIWDEYEEAKIEMYHLEKMQRCFMIWMMRRFDNGVLVPYRALGRFYYGLVDVVRRREDGSSTSHAPVGSIGMHSPTPIAVGFPGMQSPTPDESPMMNSPTIDGMSPIETTVKELDDANETTTKAGRTRAPIWDEYEEAKIEMYHLGKMQRCFMIRIMRRFDNGVLVHWEDSIMDCLMLFVDGFC
ncbi:MAP kinase-activating death domain protein [Striga asiatica]|uniref:MAP kinase-activating death domain protein n=1 Tax=Striga asiatica TaxID=4170 RepID=A0A5A7R259_STRAF|nr:MAP kinase-activating death domain protein [Striga asiatica]